MNIFEAAYEGLMEKNPAAKCARAMALYAGIKAEDAMISEVLEAPRAIPVPGRPDRPVLVAPKDLPRRKLTDDAGRAALVHAIAHIEFNAVNLALDAVYRFRGMPLDFYVDWSKVAAEEATHYGLLSDRLGQLGHAYGDFDAHNGLWEMACETDQDVMIRMALVPRVLEARGLDVTPGMINRLSAAGDEETVSILETILRDEIGHVAIGSRWFRYACEQRSLDSDRTFVDLVHEYMKGSPKGPLQTTIRKQAGFTELELKLLSEI